MHCTICTICTLGYESAESAESAMQKFTTVPSIRTLIPIEANIARTQSVHGPLSVHTRSVYVPISSVQKFLHVSIDSFVSLRRETDNNDKTDRAFFQKKQKFTYSALLST